MHAPNGGRILLSKEPGGHRGLVYVIFLKPNKDFQSAADVKRAQFDLVQSSLENALFDPTSGRRIHKPRVDYPKLVTLLELSNVPEKQFHVAFTRLGPDYLNQLCANYPEVMKVRGNKEFILTAHYPKLCEAYKARFPDRAAKVRTVHGSSREAKSQVGSGRCPF